MKFLFLIIPLFSSCQMYHIEQRLDDIEVSIEDVEETLSRCSCVKSKIRSKSSMSEVPPAYGIIDGEYSRPKIAPQPKRKTKK